MKCPLLTATVEKDTFTSLPIKVGAHVIPVLFEVHGEDAITNIEDAEEEHEFEEGSEYARLSELYGEEHVKAVYGAASMGRLKKDMKAGLALFGLEKEEEPKKPGRPKKDD